MDDIIYNEIKLHCRERLTAIRVFVTIHHPFYAALMNRMEFVPTLKIDTLATDGKHLLYNPCYIMGDQRVSYNKRDHNLTSNQKKHIYTGGLTDYELVAAIVHEVLHCAFKHFTRIDGRNKNVWNIACDYAINQIIKRDKVGKLNPNWLFDIKYERMTAEQIYDMLMDENDSDIDKIINRHGSPIDIHTDPDPGETNNPGDDSIGDSNTITPTSIKEILLDDGLEPTGSVSCTLDDVSIIASQMASMRGCPNSILDMIGEIRDPLVDWRRRIMKTMLSELTSGYWWKKPNKRTHLTPYKLPSRRPEKKIDICIAIDMSGSITKQMRMDFLSELVGIVKQHRYYRIRLMCFDTKVHNEQIFNSNDNDLNDILSYQFMGGGGTDFMVVWKHLQGIRHKPEHLFVFTDGYPGGEWGIPKYCETTFLITTKVKPPFGHHIPYRKDAKYRKKFGTL